MLYNLAPFCSQMQALRNERKTDMAGILLYQCYQMIEQLGQGTLDKQEGRPETSKYTNLLDRQEFEILKLLGEESCNKRTNHM
jgi:hypothetical protein